MDKKQALEAMERIFNYCEEIDLHLPEDERTGYDMLPDVQLVERYILGSVGESIGDDYGDYGQCYNSGFSRDNIKSTINAIPPFDVAPVVKGRWVSKNTHGYDWVFVCSNCGYVDGYPFNDRHNFCPNCGAKMEQEDL